MQIMAGAGPMERPTIQMQQEPERQSVGDYLKAKREMRERQGKMHDLLEQKREEQTELRNVIEARIREQLAAEARYM